MERQEDIRPGPPAPLKGESVAISVIVFFHVVGVIGLSMPSLRSYFLAFVPWHLLIMLAILLCSHRYIDRKLVLFTVIIFVLGYAVECTGIHTHWLFGDYSYGKTLGPQLLGVPLIAGVNWFLLTYSTGVFVQRTRLKSAAARVLLGATLLVALDLLLEPVAIRLDYWHWVNQIIPLSNYASWFLISGAMLLLFEVSRFKKQGPVAAVFLACQFVFFFALYLVGV
jgi:putative membrane protein